MGVEGLENTAENKGKSNFCKKLTPNPTPSDVEQHFLSLFRQLPETERDRLIEELEASHRQRQHNHENAGD